MIWVVVALIRCLILNAVYKFEQEELVFDLGMRLGVGCKVGDKLVTKLASNL